VDGVNGYDMIVLDGGRGLGLAHKPLHRVRAGCGSARQQLDGHIAMEFGVAGAQHQAHPPAADDLAHLI
jgi:hypothetical protein